MEEHKQDLCKDCKHCLQFSGNTNETFNIATTSGAPMPWAIMVGANCGKLGFWMMDVTMCEAFEEAKEPISKEELFQQWLDSKDTTENIIEHLTGQMSFHLEFLRFVENNKK